MRQEIYKRIEIEKCGNKIKYDLITIKSNYNQIN